MINLDDLIKEGAELEKYSEYYSNINQKLKDYAKSVGENWLDWKEYFMQKADPENKKNAIEKMNSYFKLVNNFLDKKPVMAESKLVFESLEELFEAKKKMANVKDTHKKYEKTKAQKMKDQSKKEKAEQAIKGLEDQLAKAKKPGAFKTTAEKNAKIKELQEKIDTWKNKLKELK